MLKRLRRGIACLGVASSLATAVAPLCPVAAQNPSPAAPPADGKTVKLFGRIEEVATVANPQLPVKLRAMAPRMDNSLTLKAKAQQQVLSGAIQGSFPTDWRGQWSGQLNVWSTSYSPIRYQFDADEVRKEQQLMQRGTTGQVTFDIASDNYNRLSLKPSQVVFTTTMDNSRINDTLNTMMRQQGLPPIDASQMGSGGYAIYQMMQSMPYMYALHLGDLSQGVSVTGNMLNSRVISNTIKQLAPNVLEQVVVTYDSSQNAKTGNVRNGYSENVVRFTRQGASKLYVQAVTLSYRADGKWTSRCVLTGTVSRAGGAGGLGARYGQQTSPGPGRTAGGSGGNVQNYSW